MYKCVLAIASVINYDHKCDATIWSNTYSRQLRSVSLSYAPNINVIHANGQFLP